MQNSPFYSQIKAQIQLPQRQPQFPEQEQLKCPRCESTNTKFCYYNNYNLSQPRHFCKSCKRYWTKGGALRKIPVGGGSRKISKRSSAAKRPPPPPRPPAAVEPSPPPDHKNDDSDKINSNFVGHFGKFKEGQICNLNSLLRSHEGQFCNLLDGMRANGSNLEINVRFGDSGTGQNMDPHIGLGSGGSNNGDGFLNIQGGGESETGCWSGGSNGWPDLAIYTPRSTF